MDDQTAIEHAKETPVETLMQEPVALDVMHRLVLKNCPQCGLVFGFPLCLWIERTREKGSVFCPSGHSIQLGKTDAGQIRAVTQHALDDLLNARAELQRARHEIMRLTPLVGSSTEIGVAELKRRENLMVARAQHIGSEPICILCGKKMTSDLNFYRHLRRNHGEQLRNMPAAAFD